MFRVVLRSSSVMGRAAMSAVPSLAGGSEGVAGTNLTPKLLVWGVGGGGCNAVNDMIKRGLTGVDFIACNTDAQSLAQSRAHRTLHLGSTGLGAGASPRAGYDAAAHSYDAIIDELKGNNMVFLTAGMGGGTGTGATPVIAAAARELGILSVGIVTKPFPFEGGRRRRQAEEGIAELEKYVDTLLVIPNENLLSLGRKVTMENAFHAADGVLYEGIRGVTDLIVNPGLVNVDFADVTTVMSNKGRALMGSGESDGEDRASVATATALANPLLENVELSHAQGVLVCISGNDDLSLFDVSTTTETIRAAVHEDANIIFGSSFDPSLPDGFIRVSVMVTGLDPSYKQRTAPPPEPELAVAASAAAPSASAAKPVDISAVAAANARGVWDFLKRHA